MNKNLLSIAIATAMVAPLAAQAEVKLSGSIQAEVGTVEKGTGDRQTITDSDLIGDGSPNKLKIDVEEKLGGGLTGFARIDWEFDTFNNVGDDQKADTKDDESNFKNREKYVGLKGSMAGVKLGRIQGIYKTSTLGYDKWNSTSLQARGAGGGMSGGAFGHGGFLDDVIELDFNAGDFKGVIQYVGDETNGSEGSILGALQYGNKTWEVTASVADQEFNNSDDNNLNWKLAGKANFGALYMALQYENVETAQSALGLPAAGQTQGVDAANYVFGQLGYQMGNVELIGWVSWVGSDVNDVANVTNVIGSNEDNENDTVAYSIGAKYNFNKRMFAYAGYHKTDVDGDNLDVDAFVGGLRLDF